MADAANGKETTKPDVQAYLKEQESKDFLRFIT